jgi:structural maintenance of chromosome 3 (chondroitin sulfate proteoglycan 6)
VRSSILFKKKELKVKPCAFLLISYFFLPSLFARLGYYGPVIDNIELKDTGSSSSKFRTAVEVAAGQQLFHVIVDNDSTAELLINELEKRHAGRLTFLPLNQLRIKEHHYPSESSTGIYSLLNVAINYDKKVEKAIKLIFGGKLLAKDLDAAANAAKQYNMDTLTLDGDIISRKGTFEGLLFLYV